MALEALLAYLHIASLLAVVVFLTSETALTRAEWINAAVVHRLVRVDRLYLFAALALLASGLARSYLGIKGAGWYWQQPLLHLKLTMFVLIALMSIVPTRRFMRWRQVLTETGALPADTEVKSTRRWLMWQAHLLMLVPIAAVCLARGIGTR